MVDKKYDLRVWPCLVHREKAIKGRDYTFLFVRLAILY